jgi:hypothetical protein
MLCISNLEEFVVVAGTWGISRTRGVSMWKFVRYETELDPPRIVYVHNDGSLLVVFVRESKPEGFELMLGKDIDANGVWQRFLKYHNFGKYFFGRVVEKGFYNDVVSLDRRKFNRISESERFERDSTEIESSIRQYIVDAIKGYGQANIDTMSQTESDQETVELVAELEMQLKRLRTRNLVARIKALFTRFFHH